MFPNSTDSTACLAQAVFLVRTVIKDDKKCSCSLLSTIKTSWEELQTLNYEYADAMTNKHMKVRYGKNP